VRAMVLCCCSVCAGGAWGCPSRWGSPRDGPVDGRTAHPVAEAAHTTAGQGAPVLGCGRGSLLVRGLVVGLESGAAGPVLVGQWHLQSTAQVVKSVGQVCAGVGVSAADLSVTGRRRVSCSTFSRSRDFSLSESSVSRRRGIPASTGSLPWQSTAGNARFQRYGTHRRAPPRRCERPAEDTPCPGCSPLWARLSSTRRPVSTDSGGRFSGVAVFCHSCPYLLRTRNNRSHGT
jgi:hypothetical protein